MLRDQFDLRVIFRVKLKHRSRSSRQRGVERGEESGESFCGFVRSFVGVAKPLQGGNGDGAISGAGTKTEALTQVVKKEIARRLERSEGERGGKRRSNMGRRRRTDTVGG